LAAAAALLLVCGTLPTAAQEGEQSSAGSGDLIRHRTLERADFKAEQPPLGTSGRDNYELAAITCVQVRTDPNVSMQVGSIVEADGDERYEGWLGHLRFRAFMDRDCSWWNPGTRNPEYTLQHEQIHFAIREISARRLNQDAEKLVTELHVTADSEEEVVQELKARVAALFNEHNEAALERTRTFDGDTSYGRNDERQRQWWREVERELEETESWRD
jgi:hypothetical protein